MLAAPTASIGAGCFFRPIRARETFAPPLRCFTTACRTADNYFGITRSVAGRLSRRETARGLNRTHPFLEASLMRIALSLILLLVVTISASADDLRRGRWRAAPLRTWRVFNGYNTWQPAWDTTYAPTVSPPNGTTGDGVGMPSPVPATGNWQPDATIPNAIPGTNWSNGTTTTPPSATTPSSTRVNPVPNITSEAIPTTVTPGSTTRYLNGNPSSSASFRNSTPQNNYWNTLGGSNQ